jgi:hypothetical protein
MRIGLSAAYEGFAGSALAIRWSSEKWSDLKGLGSPGMVIHDATDLSAGVEFAGPKIAGFPSAIRGGVRSRTLPFSPTTDAVKESSLNGGVGLPLAQGRLALDIGASFATRKVSGLTEKATILSVGLSIRP